MNTPRFVGVALLVASLPVLAGIAADEAASGLGSLNQQRILKQPVAVVPAPTLHSLSNSAAAVEIDIDNLDALQKVLGTVVTGRDWDAARDVLIKQLAESPALRVMAETSLPAAVEAGCGFALLARFEENNSSRRILVALIDVPGRTVCRVFDSSAATFELAARRIAAQVGDELALVRWSGKVVKLADGDAVINRGYRDGVREGQAFEAASVEPAAGGKDVPVELQVLTAKRSGFCKVVKVSDNYAIVRADKGFSWQIGDVVTLPPVRMDDRNPASRGRAAWNAVFEKK